MNGEIAISGGFVTLKDGCWLMGKGQPAAYSGTLKEIRRRGVFMADRAVLSCVESAGIAHCSDALHPFLTYLDCADRLAVVSSKILAAPAAARTGSRLVHTVPFSFKSAFAVTEFSNPSWALTATSSRTERVVLKEGEELSVKPASIVAWTTAYPAGHCQKLSLRDVFFPCRRAPQLWLKFRGPGVVWIEGAYFGKSSHLG